MNSSAQTLDTVFPPVLKLALPSPFYAVFTTRDGGVSKDGYDSLNLALHVGDDPRRVRENRAAACSASGQNAARLVVAQQVHGAEAVLVGTVDAGRGSFSHADALESADALVTRTAGLPLMSLSADCLLLALGDPEAKVVAVLHGGWRGIAAGVIANTLELMRSVGARAERIHVAGTPAIGPCCFEVGAEVATQLGARDGDGVLARCDPETGQAWIDLNAAARQRLLRAGVPETQIQLASDCTCCREDRFFSHRRGMRRGEKHTGRMGLIAWMEK